VARSELQKGTVFSTLPDVIQTFDFLSEGFYAFCRAHLTENVSETGNITLPKHSFTFLLRIPT
jgi:hypothetical protein